MDDVRDTPRRGGRALCSGRVAPGSARAASANEGVERGEAGSAGCGVTVRSGEVGEQVAFTGHDDVVELGPGGGDGRVQGRDVLMTTTLDGKIKARLPSPAGDLREPMWGPYGR